LAKGSGAEVGAEGSQDASVDAGDREERVVVCVANGLQPAERPQQGATGHRTDARDVVELGTEAPRLAESFARAVREAVRFVARPARKKSDALFGRRGMPFFWPGR